MVSDIWLGGNIVAHSRNPVAVLIDGHVFKTPWVKDDAVARCGALVLDDQTVDKARRHEPNPAIDALMARATHRGTWTLPWTTRAGKEHAGEARGRVQWGVVAPTPGAVCNL